MLRILLVDDESPARQELRYILDSLVKNAAIIEASSGEHAMQLIALEDIDIAFIDINMHGMDGITLSQEISKFDDSIRFVFATAYDQYAIKAFELNAVDYVLKPFEENRIKITVERLLNDIERKKNMEREQPVYTPPEKPLKKITVWVNGRALLVDIQNVAYIAAEDRGSLIKTAGGVYSTKETLCYFERKLEKANFLRVHRGYLINPEQVSEIQPWFNNTYMVKMTGFEKDEIPVSRNYVKRFKEIFDL